MSVLVEAIIRLLAFAIALVIALLVHGNPKEQGYEGDLILLDLVWKILIFLISIFLIGLLLKRIISSIDHNQ